MPSKLITVALLLSVLTYTHVAGARTCFIPSVDNEALGDNLYSPRICDAALIEKFWHDFDFDETDWNNGFGYHDVCNITTPLNRTLSSLWLLLNSSPTPATSPIDLSGNILRWGYNYAVQNIDELDGKCGPPGGRLPSLSGSPTGITIGALLDDNTQLLFPFFYQLTVPARFIDASSRCCDSVKRLRRRICPSTIPRRHALLA